jgi:tetratricopeptide (TPR) repeat protein
LAECKKIQSVRPPWVRRPNRPLKRMRLRARLHSPTDHRSRCCLSKTSATTQSKNTSQMVSLKKSPPRCRAFVCCSSSGAKRKPSKNLSAYDYYLRGLAAIHRWTKDANEQALRLLYKSIELDPDFPPAYGVAAVCYAQRQAHGWMADRKEEVAETARLARRAANLGWDDAIALCWGGYALAYVVHDIDTAAAMIDRGLMLNPNLTAGWRWRGFVKIWLGEPEAGIESVAYAMRLSPLDPHMCEMQLCAAHGHFFAGRAEEASSWATRVLLQQPESHTALRISAASNALAGNIKQARKAVECLQRIDPALRVSNLRNCLGPYRPEHLAMYEAGLRKAGLPE